jgi:interferon-induced GTP-binding protein Mx1
MSLNEAIEKDLKVWLGFLNEIRRIGVDQEFEIPQIALIGDQSSGKSSLLNSLTGIPFPRGTGLVTRCPTIIAMENIANNSTEWHAEISIIKDSGGISDMDGTGHVQSREDLAERIVKLTEKLIKSSTNGFSRHSIFVKIRASDVPSLILVDLPGIVRTTKVGQNCSVIAEVDDMLDYFMLQPRTIILAVIPANQDIATVDVLERAHKIDPLGLRTMGVLTKPDLVDNGAEDEVIAVVNNIRKPLALGYVIVKNRNQAQNKMNISLKDALRSEKEFFSNHERWKTLPKLSRGIEALSQKLSHCLVFQAKASLPYMKWELNSKSFLIEKDLNVLGAEVPVGDFEKNHILMQMVSRFGQIVRKISEGDYRDELSQGCLELRMKYHISEIIKELRLNVNLKAPDFNSSSYSSMLSQRLVAMRGRELPGFMSARYIYVCICIYLYIDIYLYVCIYMSTYMTYMRDIHILLYTYTCIMNLLNNLCNI